MYLLGRTVASIAAMVQQLEQELIDSYEIAKSAIFNRGETVRNFKKVVQTAILNDLRKESKFELLTDVKRLAGFIEESGGEEKYKYYLAVNPRHIINKFQAEHEILKANCWKLEDAVSKLNCTRLETYEKEESSFSKKGQEN